MNNSENQPGSIKYGSVLKVPLKYLFRRGKAWYNTARHPIRTFKETKNNISQSDSKAKYIFSHGLRRLMEATSGVSGVSLLAHLLPWRQAVNSVLDNTIAPNGYSKYHTTTGTGALLENKCNKYVYDVLSKQGLPYPTKPNKYTSLGNKFKVNFFNVSPFNRSTTRPFTVAELRNLPNKNNYFDIIPANDAALVKDGDILTYITEHGNLHTGFKYTDANKIPIIRSANPTFGVRDVPLSQVKIKDLKVFRPKRLEALTSDKNIEAKITTPVK